MPGNGAEEKVRVNHVLMIAEAIRSGTFPSIEKLARKSEVTKRTIEQDIEFANGTQNVYCVFLMMNMILKLIK